MPATLDSLFHAPSSLSARSVDVVREVDADLTSTTLSRLALAHQDWEHAEAYERGGKDALKSLLPAIEAFIDDHQPALGSEPRHQLRRTLHAFEDYVWRYIRREDGTRNTVISDAFVGGGLGI